MPSKASGADSAIAEVSQFATVNDIILEVAKNAELRKEYASLGEDEFLKKYLKSDTAQDGAGTEPPAAEGAASPDEKPEVVDGKKREGGKTADELAAENEQYERTIRELREDRLNPLERRLSETETENKALKTRLAEQDKMKAEIDKAVLPDEISIDDFAGDDIFDAEKQKKLVGSIKTLAEGYKNVRKKLAEVEGKQNTKEAVEAELEQTRSEKRAIEDEQAEIDRLRKNNSDLFANKRAINEVESDYINFMKGLARVGGYSGNLYDAKNPGMFAPEINELYRKYHDEKAGVDLRKKAEVSNVKMPDDFDDILLLHKLREIRNSNFKRDETGLRPWSFSEALEDYIAKQPSEKKENPKMDITRIKKDREMAAIKNREQHAKELPANGGANPMDLNAITDVDVKAKLSRWKSMGKEEDRAWLDSVMRQSGLSQGEIDNALKRK